MSKKFVGRVAVDSGQICIVDPCYIFKDKFEYKSEPTGLPYDSACRVTLGDKGFGQFLGDSAVVSSSGYGDGYYEVWADIQEVNNGRIKSLTITFIEEEEE